MTEALSYDDIAAVLDSIHGIKHVTLADQWAHLLSKQPEAALIPRETALAVWGETVIDARFIADCPECGEAPHPFKPDDSVFQLCGYHESRHCDGCGGINGTVLGCICP